MPCDGWARWCVCGTWGRIKHGGVTDGARTTGGDRNGRVTHGGKERKNTHKNKTKIGKWQKGCVCAARGLFLSFFCFSLSIRLASLKNFRVEPEEEKVLIRMAHVLAELLREAILCRGKRRDPSGPQGALVHRQTKRRFEDSLVKRRNAKVRLYGENKLVTYGESGCE